MDLHYETLAKFKGDYIHKIKLKKIKVPKYYIPLTREMIENITLFKRKDRWGVYLMGKGVINLNKEDYEIFADSLK